MARKVLVVGELESYELAEGGEVVERPEFAIIDGQILQIAAGLQQPLGAVREGVYLNAIEAELLDQVWVAASLDPLPYLILGLFGHELWNISEFDNNYIPVGFISIYPLLTYIKSLNQRGENAFRERREGRELDQEEAGDALEGLDGDEVVLRKGKGEVVVLLAGDVVLAEEGYDLEEEVARTVHKKAVGVEGAAVDEGKHFCRGSISSLREGLWRKFLCLVEKWLLLERCCIWLLVGFVKLDLVVYFVWDLPDCMHHLLSLRVMRRRATCSVVDGHWHFLTRLPGLALKPSPRDAL